VGVKSYFDADVLNKSRQQHYAYNFREVLVSWCKTGWTSDREVFEGSATDILGEMSNTPTVEHIAKQFKLYAAATALTTLAREEGSGVEYLSEHGRTFRITKSDLLEP